jgi:hypothetical protein
MIFFARFIDSAAQWPFGRRDPSQLHRRQRRAPKVKTCDPGGLVVGHGVHPERPAVIRKARGIETHDAL